MYIVMFVYYVLSKILFIYSVSIKKNVYIMYRKETVELL
jgi:hypothetical protein